MRILKKIINFFKTLVKRRSVTNVDIKQKPVEQMVPKSKVKRSMEGIAANLAYIDLMAKFAELSKRSVEIERMVAKDRTPVPRRNGSPKK